MGSADNILVLTIEMSVKEGWINPKRIERGTRRKVHRENVTSGDESDFCGRGFSELKSEDETQYICVLLLEGRMDELATKVQTCRRPKWRTKGFKMS